MQKFQNLSSHKICELVFLPLQVTTSALNIDDRFGTPLNQRHVKLIYIVVCFQTQVKA